MSFSIATWNINSVRLRSGLVEQFLNKWQPDILCLQEIKCQNDQFPEKNFRKLGYEHMAVHGQKGYHGVATISKVPLEDISSTDYCEMGDTRHIATSFEIYWTDIAFTQLAWFRPRACRSVHAYPARRDPHPVMSEPWANAYRLIISEVASRFMVKSPREFPILVLR